MSTILQRTFTVILSVEFIIGTFGNGFIAVVNTMDWVKRRKISPVDQILFVLAVSRIALLWLVLLNWWMFILCPGEWNTERYFVIIHNIWTVFNQISVWFATIFSIFCFFKVANFSNTIFLYFKIRVKKVMTVTLLVSLVLLCLNLIVINAPENVLNSEYKVNISYSLSLNNTQLSLLFSFVNTVFVFIPFSVSLVTFLLLIFSLWKHLRKMQHAKGCKDASTTAHIRALQTVTASLVLYAIFFFSFVVKNWMPLLVEGKILFLFIEGGRIAFPSVHSCVLILGNAKLRKASLSVLLWLRCRHKDGKP